MREGLSAGHPSWARDLVQVACSEAEALYATQPLRQQVIRGDGPEVLLTKTGDLSGVIDWGGIRCGSIADDIGCWTLHLGMLHQAYHQTSETFLRGYTSVTPLVPAERAAVPAFQRLRLASRLCYVTDPAALAFVQAWWLAWRQEQQEVGWEAGTGSG